MSRKLMETKTDTRNASHQDRRLNKSFRVNLATPHPVRLVNVFDTLRRLIMMAANPMASNGTIPPQTASPTENGKSYRGPFAIMTILFFMWGFMTVFNDILIPRFKEAFTLNYVEAMLVQFAFFGAYCLGSFAYFMISASRGDPIARIGYKNGVVIGLIIATVGSSLFWPAANLAPRS